MEDPTFRGNRQLHGRELETELWKKAAEEIAEAARWLLEYNWHSDYRGGEVGVCVERR